jgi:hypothetical protein
MPPYKVFRVRHPEYDAGYWRRCFALYAGGKTLLGDRALMKDVFPPHLHEEDFVYQERVKRAYYIPYPGEIIDSIVACLFGEQLTVTAEPAPHPFYADFLADVSPPGGKTTTINELLKEQVTQALCKKRTWTMVDLPRGGPPEAYDSVAEQERDGVLDAYACVVHPECVVDWECDETGELMWALVRHEIRKRAALVDGRDMITEEYTYWTRTNWERYAITYKVDKPPQDGDEVPSVGTGPHTFGVVPLVPFELPDGLWAMGKIESMAAAHLNKRNALTWAEYKSLFPVLAAFQQPPDALNPITDDPNRALNQKYGQGRVLQFGDKDDLRYISPDTAPYLAAMQDLDKLRDEMHRVLHSMALSVDNSAAALGRSADSKQMDSTATAVVLRAIGQLVREHVRRILVLVEKGRGDKPVTWAISGMEKFNDISTDALVQQALTVETVSIPSATFQQVWKYKVAKRLLGDDATEAQMEEVLQELEQNISNEQFQAPTPMQQFEAATAPALPEEEDEDEEDEDEAEDEGEE